ncbi:hypothetical protein FYK55_15425 [Roseiconus nitratireducens]|uniref:NolW-like domain-containing protein n=1 Tax=Roseiconus nitratireducens TaxID=2605748 RepID=A0A5M6D3Y3_9BACT|nr:hypothetical protein [Roseiconus nitratireducens]KAA5542194.1 hypothetical protein FYK55_15425 [Roseiconus nitratireducens]
MSSTMIPRRFISFGLAFLLALASPGLLSAQDDQPKANQKDQDQKSQENQPTDRSPTNEEGSADKDEGKQKEEVRELEIFELQHRTPREIQQLITIFSTPTTNPGLGGVSAIRDRRREQPTISVDNQNGLLFVRGLEPDLKRIRNIIDAVDVDSEKMERQKIEDLRVIPLSGQQSREIHRVLSELQLQHQMLTWEGGQTLLVFHQQSDRAQAMFQQAEKVIDKMLEKGEEQQQATQSGAENQNGSQDNSSGGNPSAGSNEQASN